MKAGDDTLFFKNREGSGGKDPKAGDRGPFGEGPAVDYKDKDGSSSSES